MFPSGMGDQQRRGSVGQAVALGFVVAIAGSIVWGVIAYAIKYQFSLMALAIGFGVGTVMARFSGGARSPVLAAASAALAVLGCALGSLLAEILVLMSHGASLRLILSNMNVVFQHYPSVVGALGFLFWLIAALYGYRVAMGMPMRRGRMGMRRMRQAGGQLPGQPPPYGGSSAYGTQPGLPPATGFDPSQQQPTFGFGPEQPPPTTNSAPGS